MSPELKPLPRGDAGRQLPAFLEAQEVRGRPDLETIAEGDVEFRRGGVVIRSDRLTYEQSEDLAIARGNVRISRDGNRYSGPELQLKVQRFEGYFLNPTYYFARTGAGGTAQRIDFIDEQRSIASGATYTSCTPDGSGTPAWLLSTGTSVGGSQPDLRASVSGKLKRGAARIGTPRKRSTAPSAVPSLVAKSRLTRSVDSSHAGVPEPSGVQLV